MKTQLLMMYGGMDFNHIILYCCLAFFAGIGAAKLQKRKDK